MMTDEKYKIMKEIQLDMLKKREKWKLEEKAEKYDKLKEAVEKIKAEIKDLDLGFADEEYRTGITYGIMKINQIIDKHTEGLL